MKWIEVVYGEQRIMYNLNEVVKVSYDDHTKRLILTGDIIISILSNSHAEAMIKYDLIKSYINYGPTPNGLTVESE